MEIKVSEYVRTKNGKIGKVIDISNITGQSRKKYLIKWNISKAYYITNITIIKSSKNIIDLIEVGDYVNGYKVLEIRRNDNRILIGVYKDTETVIYKTLANENVKTILTHEQFEQNAYRLEE